MPASHRLGSTAHGAIVVIGNGGGAFWSAFREYAGAAPDTAHPLDVFTAAILAAHAAPVAERLGLHPELRFPFEATAPPLSFVHLAEAAGLGRRGLLGVLLHPEFGPWMALRGALLVDEAPVAARPAAGFEPCAACRERPCMSACPGDAIAAPDGWNVPRCIDFRVAGGDANPCVDRCHARVACVYGRAHVYPADALAYHQRRAFAVMRRAR